MTRQRQARRNRQAGNAELDMQWFMPTELPPPGQPVTVARVRLDKQEFTLALREVSIDTYAPHRLTSAPVPVVVTGWIGTLDGDPLNENEPLGFLDAFYALLASFVETVPRFSKLCTQALSTRSQYEGWDKERMEANIDHAQTDPVRAPDPREDTGGA